MRKFLAILLACIGAIGHPANAADPLQHYNVDPSGVTVSGFSSGGGMASQLHVALSAKIRSAAVFAGVPYYCAGDGSAEGVSKCLQQEVVAGELVEATMGFAAEGLIDDPENLADDRVFLFCGTADDLINLSMIVQEYYSAFVDSSSMKGEFSIPAGHGLPTEDYGNDCGDYQLPYLNDCDYSGAFESVDWIYGGGLARPQGDVELLGTFASFDQTEFVDSDAGHSMDAEGFVYVPGACLEGDVACRLHVVLHGCGSGREMVGDLYARESGFNEVGELNDVIVLYPQVAFSLVNPINPLGCWDVYGYTGPDYAWKEGVQIQAIERMIDRIVSGS